MRPAVDVVIPFGGRDLAPVLARAAALDVGAGDSVTVVDNRARASWPPAPSGVRLVAAAEVSSSYFARNAGALGGGAPWIVFLDSDVVAPPGHLERLFSPLPGERTAVVGGEVRDDPSGRSAAARYAHLRGAMGQAGNVALGFAATANCAVRREAFAEAGGFRDDVRSGGDADLCLRLRSLGWELEFRPEAEVLHRSRATIRGLLAQRAKHGAGAAWVAWQHPGALPARPLPGVIWWGLRRAASGLIALARGDRDAALLGLLDGPSLLAFELGRHLPNQARGQTP